jgi:glycerol uptake facilitator-like aquaporin
VVGSGIMAERLAGANEAIALLANSLATGFALILAFAERSGAHFNPVVALALRRDFAWKKVAPYLAAQTAVARELVATFGLVFLILSLSRKNARAAPFAVGGYIAAAYWFTSSTSFANPAVTLARGFTDTFAGIGLGNVPAFVMFQILGAALALAADRALRENP